MKSWAVAGSTPAATGAAGVGVHAGQQPARDPLGVARRSAGVGGVAALQREALVLEDASPALTRPGVSVVAAASPRRW